MTRKYIGSGDIAAIVALYRPELAYLAKWGNATDVWLRLVHGIQKPRKASMSRGLREENPLRKVYRDTIGECSDLPGMIRHPRFEWAGGSPDGLAPGLVVELKTHSIFAAHQWGDEPWGDKVPDKYNLQCQWLMGICGRPACHVLVGFGQDHVDEYGDPMFAWTETRPYKLAFDPVLYAEMEVLAERFCSDHVMSRVAPDMKPVANRRAFKRLTDDNADEGNGSVREVSVADADGS